MYALTFVQDSSITDAICRISAHSTDILTSRKTVFSTRPLTILAACSFVGLTSSAVMIGVLIVFAALMISLIRGTPRVTFIEATPAKWNVFKVICVPGSPMD